MNKTKTKRLLTVLLIFVLCLSFAVPGLARRRWYSYDNGDGGLFWTTTWYPDSFAAFLGMLGRPDNTQSFTNVTIFNYNTIEEGVAGRGVVVPC